MKFLKLFLEHSSPIEYNEVQNGGKTEFKPAFGAKKGTTDFYQIKKDNKVVGEIEVKKFSFLGKPEIMSAFSSVKGGGRILVENILKKYLTESDEVFLIATKSSLGFWTKMGATQLFNDQRFEELVKIGGYDRSYLKSYLCSFKK